jgi:ferredoxin-NADP reductase
VRNFRVERKVIEDAAQSVCSLYLVPEDGQPLPRYEAGQYLTLKLDLPGGSVTRCYSLSESPRPDGYRISVKRMPAPPGGDFPAGVSSNGLHDHVVVGSVLAIRAPAGHFHLNRCHVPVVLIAGGIGITPMLSMIGACVAEQPWRDVHLFVGVRNGREVVMRAELEALAAKRKNVQVRWCFSDPLPEDSAGRDYQHRGWIDVALLRSELIPGPHHYYLCGPGPMMESLVPALEDWGVPDSHIHFEAFGPASVKRRNAADVASNSAAGEAEMVVTFARSGKQVTWTGEGNLLELAEANGIDVDSGCRAGGCGTCQTTIREGEVYYPEPPDFDPEPGTCLICVCRPKTRVTLEA